MNTKSFYTTIITSNQIEIKIKNKNIFYFYRERCTPIKAIAGKPRIISANALAYG